MNNDNPETSKTWEHAIDIFNADKSIAICITKCTLPPKFEGAIPLSHYTWELCRFYDDRRIRHFQFRCSIVDGTAVVEKFPFDEVSDLIEQAEEWVRTERQKREDAITERRIQHVASGVSERKGLKELSKVDALKYKKE